MATRHQSALSREERDLLIRLDTKMTGMEATLNDLKGNFTGRLLNLEANACSKLDLKSVEDDVAFLNRWVWGAIGALTIIQIGVGIGLTIYF